MGCPFYTKVRIGNELSVQRVDELRIFLKEHKLAPPTKLAENS